MLITGATNSSSVHALYLHPGCRALPHFGRSHKSPTRDVQSEPTTPPGCAAPKKASRGLAITYLSHVCSATSGVFGRPETTAKVKQIHQAHDRYTWYTSIILPGIPYCRSTTACLAGAPCPCCAGSRGGLFASAGQRLCRTSTCASCPSPAQVSCKGVMSSVMLSVMPAAIKRKETHSHDMAWLNRTRCDKIISRG